MKFLCDLLLGIRQRAELTCTSLDITILADNDYYSSSTSFDETTARFRNFNKPITKVHKTGLGSSAALVTSLVGAVLSHSSILSTTTEEAQNRVVEPRSLERLHRLAQGAHCAAQGKIGSGFDVASAVFGSCLYRRFSPAILENLGSFEGEEFGRRLVEVVDSDTVWDYEINAFGKVKIPPGLRLVMCDVDCGSETPGMVKQVLKWRDENNVEADELWNELHTHNEGLARLMTSISEGSNVDYRRLTECFQDIRSCIRRMSEKAGVPIEPAEQTSLLDSCCNIPGVLGGVVPGAGGYDAITLLIHDDMEVISALERHLQSWKFEAGGGTVKLLGVRGEMEGFRLEDAASYRAWL